MTNPNDPLDGLVPSEEERQAEIRRLGPDPSVFPPVAARRRRRMTATPEVRAGPNIGLGGPRGLYDRNDATKAKE
jgi:hypothetical protein